MRRPSSRSACRSTMTLRSAMLLVAAVICLWPATAHAQSGGTWVLRADGVWDGESDALEVGWVVVVQGERILAVGPESEVSIPTGARELELPGTTLMPGRTFSTMTKDISHPPAPSSKGLSKNVLLFSIQ